MWAVFHAHAGIWLDQRTRDLAVHLPAEGVEPVRRMLDAAYIFEELMACALNFEPLQSSTSFRWAASR